MSGAKLLKSIVLTATAQDHHISVKVKSILRWLKAGNQVNVAINGKSDRQKSMEAVCKHIEREIKNGAEIKQKIIKPESIRFTLRPTIRAADYVINESQDQEQDISEIVEGKDLLSDEFEQELNESINYDKLRRKKK